MTDYTKNYNLHWLWFSSDSSRSEVLSTLQRKRKFVIQWVTPGIRNKTDGQMSICRHRAIFIRFSTCSELFMYASVINLSLIFILFIFKHYIFLLLVFLFFFSAFVCYFSVFCLLFRLSFGFVFVWVIFLGRNGFALVYILQNNLTLLTWEHFQSIIWEHWDLFRERVLLLINM